VSEPVTTQEKLAVDLTDLGFTAVAGRVLEGRISISHALQHVKREHGTLLSTGYFFADDLHALGVPEQHSAVIGSQTASFAAKELMVAFTRRKVEHAAANGRKANVYRITEKGRQELSKLVGVDANVPGPDQVAVRGVGVDPGESSTGGRGQAVGPSGFARAKGRPADATPGGASPDQSRARSSMEEQRTSKPTVAGSSPAGRSQQQCGVTRRSTNEHARSEANPATARIDPGTGQEGEPGGKSEVPAAAVEPLTFDIPDGPSYMDPDQRAA
jgi:hypothetical protein